MQPQAFITITQHHYLINLGKYKPIKEWSCNPNKKKYEQGITHTQLSFGLLVERNIVGFKDSIKGDSRYSH